jgi:signal transduction histidine kinase
LDMETAIEAMKRGAIDYIVKPFNMDAVAMSVDRANHIYSLRMENKQYKESLESSVLQRTQQVLEFAEELKQKNLTMQSINRELTEANQKLENFLNQAIVMDKISTVGLLSGMLIHGIANPLAVIQGIADMIMKRFANDPVTVKELTMMNTYIQQLFDLVNQIRGFVKTEQFMFTKLDLVEVIRNSVDLLHGLAKRNRIDINVTSLPDRVFVQGNGSQLQQVFVNIIQNAIHAVGQDGGVKISGWVNSHFTYIVIEDTGCGINKDHLDKIFKMFFTTKTDGQGTGLGLFICKEIIEKHGGTVSISSQESKGTKVTVQLPFIKNDDMTE